MCRVAEIPQGDRMYKISSFSKFRNPLWKWLVPVLHPTEMPNEDQTRSPLLYSWTFHWEHVTGNNILDKHRPILTASTCLKTSDLPPGRPFSCNCQLPPAGSAPHCSRGGQSIYKFLRLWWLPPKQRIVSICNCGGDFLKHFSKLWDSSGQDYPFFDSCTLLYSLRLWKMVAFQNKCIKRKRNFDTYTFYLNLLQGCWFLSLVFLWSP